MGHVSPLKASPLGKRRLAELDSDSDYIESDDEEEEEEEEEGGGEELGRSKEMLNPEALAELGLIRPLKKKVINTLHNITNHTLLLFTIKSTCTFVNFCYFDLLLVLRVGGCVKYLLQLLMLKLIIMNLSLAS